MLKASEHDTDSERSFLLMATPLSGLPMAVSSLYAGMCLALTRESISSFERRKHPSWKKKEIHVIKRYLYQDVKKSLTLTNSQSSFQ